MNFWAGFQLFCCIVYLIAFFYVIIKNPYAVINWVLGLLFLYVACWSLCDAVLFNPALGIDRATGIVRIKSLFWTSFLTFYFLFVLFLTGNRALLSSPFTYIFIFCMPALFTYQVVAGNVNECCMQLQIGYMATWKNTFWAFAFYAYYVLLFIAGLVLLVRYRNSGITKTQRSMADIMLWSIIAVFVLGTGWSVTMKRMNIYLPIDANNAFLIFTVGFIYCVEKYQFLTLTGEKTASKVAEAINEGLVLASRDGELLSVNNAALRIFGVREGELKGAAAADLLGRLGIPLPQGRAQHERETAITRPDGTVRDVLSSVNALIDGGECVGYVCVIKDMTQLRRAETDARDTQARLRDVAGATRDWIWEMDSRGTVTFTNSAPLELFHTSPETLHGRRPEAVFERADLERLEEAAAGSAAGKRQFSVTAAVRGGGKEVILETNGVPFFDNAGNYAGARCVSRDVTSRVRSEEELKNTVLELKRSNEELEKFAYVASHDLKEPLRMVSSYVQLIKKRMGDRVEGDMADFINYATEGAVRMNRLISDLLTYSRIGRAEKVHAPFETHDAVNQVLSVLQLKIEEAGATVEVEGIMPRITGDRMQFEQLIQNLVENALKFRQKGDVKIAVGVTTEEGYHKFYVRDNGIGILPEYREKIFELFQRLHSREEYEGTGIGLAICRKIAERHGGRMWVESEGQGKGSTFYFTIPV